MGKAKRTVPNDLAKKLVMIRLHLGFSLEGMTKALEIELPVLGYTRETLHSGYIADFESSKREPTLPVLLAYARISKVNLEILVDDRLELRLS